MSLYRIGVDVGGTNTDAAILDIRELDTHERGVLATYKTSTTQNITSGVENAIRTVLKDSNADQNRVISVTIGTTHFINALVEADARRLDRVAIVRLCGPFTKQLPPFSDFPVGLREILDGGVYYLDGGLEFDRREIMPLDHQQIRSAAKAITDSGVNSIALVGVFSALDHDGAHEDTCKKLLLDENPHLKITCSHSIGPTGLLERENATILNAAILRTGHEVKNSLLRAMHRLNLQCPLFLSQNDGTLIDAETAANYPVKTFASGPTNSMTGAAFLAGLDRKPDKEAIAESSQSDPMQPQTLVIDIGGTTTDVCALLPSGFPRQAPGFVEIGGVRTAFSMPEVVSVGLGGGSKITAVSNGVHVGPSSVGHQIQKQAVIFGGQTLTATDIAVATGKVQLGDPSLLRDVSQAVIDGAQKEIQKSLETLVERMRVSAAPVHVLLVGGGAILVAEDLKGVDKCTRPVHHGAANAVGAAIAKVSGDVDVIEVLNGRKEKDVIEAACQKAISFAIAKGAAENGVKVVQVDKMQLQYMKDDAIRIQVRAVGKLAVPDGITFSSQPLAALDSVEDEEAEETATASVLDALEPSIKPSLKVDLETYRPEVRGSIWYVSDVDLELIATGCGVLGTGGGGPTHHEYIKSLHALRTNERGRIRIISPKAVQDDDVICFGCWYGSPSAINERIAGGNEIATGINAVNKVMGYKKFHGMFNLEIGGGNGMSAFPPAAQLDVPIIDGDGMGRAYPTIAHVTMNIFGQPMIPCVLSDARGNATAVMGVDSSARLESIIRNTAIELGLACAAWYLGRAVHKARRTKISYADAIFQVSAGKLLFTGKIVDVRRFIGGGYTMGAVIIGPVGDDERELEVNKASNHVPNDRHMIIPFQNEFLYAAYCDAVGSKPSQEVVCTVPHLISVLGQDGEAIGSQDLRYGLRASVIALPAHPLWKTEKALKVGGPEGFKLDIPVVGVDEEFAEAKSVIDEFDTVTKLPKEKTIVATEQRGLLSWALGKLRF